MTARVSPAARLTVPVTVGVLSFVSWVATAGAAGAVVSTTSSPVVVSVLVLPTVSVTVAVTL